VNELDVRRAGPSELRAIVLELPAYAAAAKDPRANDLVARVLISRGDRETILADLKQKDANGAVAGGGQKVFEWYRANGTYCYYHPGDRALRVDLEARAATTPTDAYRAKNPWKEGEGPDSPANPARREHGGAR
jgi:hypothetical protein